MQLDLKTIEAREKAIADQMAALQKDLEDLAAARRVLDRLSGATIATAEARVVREKTIDTSRVGRPRPPGTPTNVEMAEFVLMNAEKDGKDGLTASELVDAIRSRYWPGLTHKQILPSLYGIAKDATRIKKTKDGKFKRVKKADAAQ